MAPRLYMFACGRTKRAINKSAETEFCRISFRLAGCVLTVCLLYPFQVSFLLDQRPPPIFCNLSPASFLLFGGSHTMNGWAISQPHNWTSRKRGYLNLLHIIHATVPRQSYILLNRHHRPILLTYQMKSSPFVRSFASAL